MARLECIRSPQFLPVSNSPAVRLPAPHGLRVIAVITQCRGILEVQNGVISPRMYPLAGRFSMPLKQSLLINFVTGKEAISRFCCRPILAGQGQAVTHPEPEFLHERPEASGMAAIVKNGSINFVIEP